MSKRLLYALLLMGLMVVILLLNAPRGRDYVSLGFFDVPGLRSVIYFAFISVGVAIGILIK